VGGHAVMLAAAIGTSSLILPTLLLYREPPCPAQEKPNQAGLRVTLMNAFEIIYSPFAPTADQGHTQTPFDDCPQSSSYSVAPRE